MLSIELASPKREIDPSQYWGVGFWARVGPQSTRNIRVTLTENQPAGTGAAQPSPVGYGHDLPRVAESWTEYQFSFADVKPLGLAALPVHPKSPTRATSLQVTALAPGAVDLWIDEVTLIGCEPVVEQLHYR
jgi:hypothetical protein